MTGYGKSNVPSLDSIEEQMRRQARIQPLAQESVRPPIHNFQAPYPLHMVHNRIIPPQHPGVFPPHLMHHPNPQMAHGIMPMMSMSDAEAAIRAREHVFHGNNQQFDQRPPAMVHHAYNEPLNAADVVQMMRQQYLPQSIVNASPPVEAEPVAKPPVESAPSQSRTNRNDKSNSNKDRQNQQRDGKRLQNQNNNSRAQEKPEANQKPLITINDANEFPSLGSVPAPKPIDLTPYLPASSKSTNQHSDAGDQKQDTLPSSSSRNKHLSQRERQQLMKQEAAKHNIRSGGDYSYHKFQHLDKSNNILDFDDINNNSQVQEETVVESRPVNCFFCLTLFLVYSQYQLDDLS